MQPDPAPGKRPTLSPNPGHHPPPGGRAGLRDRVVAHQGPIGAVFALVLALGLTQGLPMAGARWGFDPLGFPMPAWVDSRPSRVVLLFFAYLLAVIAVPLGLKLVESGQVARWARTSGVITRSQPGFRTIRRAQGLPEQRRVADIAYEFTVPGPDGRPRRLTGTRVDISEEPDASAVPEVLARYPVGKAVFVHYDPARPETAVLEVGRDDLRKTVVGLAWLAAVLAALALPVMLLATNADWLGARIAARPMQAAAAGLGLVSLLLLAVFAGQWRQARAMAAWPRVPGEVVQTAITPYHTGSRTGSRTGPSRTRRSRLPGGASVGVSQGRGGVRLAYMPTVEYAYEVAGVRHLSRSIRLDSELGMSEAEARALIARYPEGARVEVRVDPANPERAALECGLGIGWSMLVAGLAFGAAALGLLVWGGG